MSLFGLPPIWMAPMAGEAASAALVAAVSAGGGFGQLGAAYLVGYGVVIGLSVWLAFSAAGRIARVLGKTGINVMTRLMGLILAALAVEVMSDGLIKLFPVLTATLR